MRLSSVGSLRTGISAVAILTTKLSSKLVNPGRKGENAIPLKVKPPSFKKSRLEKCDFMGKIVHHNL
jgi:hypothetical protein